MRYPKITERSPGDLWKICWGSPGIGCRGSPRDSPGKPGRHTQVARGHPGIQGLPRVPWELLRDPLGLPGMPHFPQLAISRFCQHRCNGRSEAAEESGEASAQLIPNRTHTDAAGKGVRCKKGHGGTSNLGSQDTHASMYTQVGY